MYFSPNDGVRPIHSAATDAGFALARMTVRFPSPAALRNVSTDRLIKLRDQYRQERGRFRLIIHEQGQALVSLPSEAALRDHMSALSTRIEDEIRAQRSLGRELAVGDAWSLLSISVPASLPAMAALAGVEPIIATVAGIAAIGLGGTHWFLERRRKRKDAAADFPWYYLMLMERELSHKDSTNVFNDGLRDLIVD